MQGRDSEAVVRSVLESGEKILWHGRPNVDAAVPKGGGGVARFAITLLAFGGGLYFVAERLGMGGVSDLLALLSEQPGAGVAIGFVLLFPILLRLFKLDGPSRLRRHFENQVYAVTDRRVLVIEKNDVQAFSGDELDRPIVRPRSGAYGDVVFANRKRSSGSSGSGGDPVQRERRTVGFKALSKPEEMRAYLESWIAGELQESAEEVADFVASQRDPDPVGFSSPTGTASVRHRPTGLVLEYPEAWSAQVRKKKKPFGKTFMDSEKWKGLGDGDDWNLIRVEGPAGCVVDVEVFETPPTAEYDSMVNSRLASLAGELIDSNPGYEQNGLRGFTVTRRSAIQANQSTGAAGVASVVTPFRYTVLHDGRRQLCIMSKWPEASPDLADAVALVVQSARLE